MQSMKLSDFAAEKGYESDLVLAVAQALRMGGKTLDSSVSSEEADRLQAVLKAMPTTCCQELVEVMRRIEARLPVEPAPDSAPEVAFLELRAALGSRAQYDPVSPRTPEGRSIATRSGVLAATARWCDGRLLNVTWVGKNGGSGYVVEVRQADRTDDFDIADKLTLERFDASSPIDVITVKKGDQVLAVGGPLAPWLPEC